MILHYVFTYSSSYLGLRISNGRCHHDDRGLARIPHYNISACTSRRDRNIYYRKKRKRIPTQCHQDRLAFKILTLKRTAISRMPKAYFDHDPITLQEGSHIGAVVGDKTIEPDGMEMVTGEVDRVIIRKSSDSTLELKCTQDVRFMPGEQVILQQLGKLSRIYSEE